MYSLIYLFIYLFIYSFTSLFICKCVCVRMILKGDMLKPTINPKTTSSSCTESFGCGHREALQTRKTPTLRYVDIYTLGASMPEETLPRRPAMKGCARASCSFFSTKWHPHT